MFPDDAAKGELLSEGTIVRTKAAKFQDKFHNFKGEITSVLAAHYWVKMITGGHATKKHKFVHKMVEPWDAAEPSPANAEPPATEGGGPATEGAEPATEGGGGGEPAASSKTGGEGTKSTWKEAGDLWTSDTPVE